MRTVGREGQSSQNNVVRTNLGGSCYLPHQGLHVQVHHPFLHVRISVFILYVQQLAK